MRVLAGHLAQLSAEPIFFGEQTDALPPPVIQFNHEVEIAMSLQNQIPDKTLLKNVLQRMMRKGVNSSRVKATVHGGAVTITGTIDYGHERRLILNAAKGIAGVKRVVDQLQVEKKKRN